VHNLNIHRRYGKPSILSTVPCLNTYLGIPRFRNATARDQVYLVSQPFNVHLVVLQQVPTRRLPFKIISATVLMLLILTTEPTFPVYAKMLLSARIQKVFLLKLHLSQITFLAILVIHAIVLVACMPNNCLATAQILQVTSLPR
jgi:hypothetical protein